MGHVEVGPYAHVLIDMLVEVERKLVALRLHLTKVGGHGVLAEVAGHTAVATAHEDVVTAVAEEVEATGEHAVQNRVVDTEVPLLNRLPVHVGVAEAGLAVPGVGAVAAVDVDRRLAAVGPGVLIEEASADVVVTNLTIRGADLQHVYIFLDGLPELLLAHGPADGA